MNGRNRSGNSAGLSWRFSFAYIFSSVPCAKHSSGIVPRPFAARRRITSRITTVFMKPWWAMARVNRSPVVSSISSIHSATSFVRRAR